MKSFAKATSLIAAAAVATTLGWATTIQAAPLTPCAGDELAGDWLVLYQLRDPEYCKLTVDGAGLVTDAACYTRRQKPIREEISGTFVLDPATCAVSGDLDFARPAAAEKRKRKGKGKYGPFSVEAQLSEDRSTLVGLFRFRKHLSHVTAQRTQ